MEELLKLKQQVDKAKSKLKKLAEKLKGTCHHPDEFQVKTSKYHSAGYDYCASTTYTTTCKICGKTTIEEVEHEY